MEFQELAKELARVEQECEVWKKRYNKLLATMFSVCVQAKKEEGESK